MSAPETVLETAPSFATPTWLRAVHGAHRDFFDQQIVDMHSTLLDVTGNRLQHLVPVLLATGQDVPTMRNAVGKSVWRKIHHASEQTNFLRSLVWLRFRADARWADIVNLKTEHLRSCRNAIDWPTAVLTDRLTEPGRFLWTAMLYRDVVKMGGDAECDWSLAKLKREHGKLSTQYAIANADPRDWCAPFETTLDGFVFSRLTSDRAFVIEGRTQRHCVATMREEAQRGEVAVLRCEGRERATVLIKPDRSLEIAGLANASVSARCAKAAQKACALLGAEGLHAK